VGKWAWWRGQDAPYLLEVVAADWASQAVAVRLALLTAAAKLFFARPPECQALLGSVLASAAADTDQDIRDRSLLYYRCARFCIERSSQFDSGISDHDLPCGWLLCHTRYAAAGG